MKKVIIWFSVVLMVVFFALLSANIEAQTQLATWGENSSGQLGDGTNNPSNIPIEVLNLNNIASIDAGRTHSLALRNDGTVWSWGENGDGQLGDGTNSPSNIPVQVLNLTGITAIAGGNYHSLALKTDGTVWTWGNGEYGQLGDGSWNSCNTPVKVLNLTDVIEIAGGNLFSLALKNDGTVWSWGWNAEGELGDGTNNTSNIPVQVLNLTGIDRIASGDSHALALKDGGTVWSWGYNSDGELGDGTNTSSSVPVQVLNLSDVISISGGRVHSLAIKTGGSVWTWGDNSYGQLGDGSNAPTNLPVQVLTLTGITTIAGGEGHSLALKSDHTVWAWGRNDSGQLGNGLNLSSNLPVQVSNLTNADSISAGGFHSVSTINSCPSIAGGTTNICPSMIVALSFAEGYVAYQWIKDDVDITGATSSTYNASASGIYKVRVTDSDAITCTSPGHSVTIIPSPIIEGIQPACVTVSLTTQSFSAYQWFRNSVLISGATSQSYDTVAPGNYTVLVTDALGCQALSPTFAVYSYPSTPIVTGSDTGCGSVSLSTGIYAGYQWLKDGVDIAGATNQNYAAMESGIYSVRVSNSGGCTATSTGKAVTIYPVPVPAVIGSNNGCDTVSLTTEAFVSYQWIRDGIDIVGETNQNFVATESGTYSVRAVGTNGCIGTSIGKAIDVFFTPAPPVIAQPESGCGAIGLSTDTYAGYQWIKDGADIPGATNQSYSAIESGTYSVRIMSSDGCSAISAGKAITVYPVPVPSVMGSNSGCDAVALSTEPFVSYQWIKDGIDIPGETSQDYTASQSGTYSVRVISNDGCPGTSTGKAVTIYLTPTPVVTGFLEGPEIAFTDNDQTDFNAGIYSNTQWNSSNGWLDLTVTGKTNKNGQFTSRAFDALPGSSWNTISWLTQRPLWKELPNNKLSESGYPSGNANMTGNIFLMHLNESPAQNGTIIYETSGANLNGMLTTNNGSTNKSIAGKLKTALSFDGIDDQISTSARFATIGSSFTMECWINPSATHQIDTESTSGTGGTSGQRWVIFPTYFSSLEPGNSGAGISAGTNGISVYEHASSYIPALLVYQATVSGWTHIVVVYSNNRPTLYVNGSLVRTGLQSTKTVHPSADYIGGGQYGYFSGGIDEYAVFSRVLSATEISDHYKRGVLRLKYQIRACDDPSCAGESLVGPDGTTATYYSEQQNPTNTPPSIAIPSPLIGGYFQYKAYFETDNSTITPELKEVTASCSSLIPSSSGCDGSVLRLGTSEAYTTYQWIKDGLDIPSATLRYYETTSAGDYAVRVSAEGGCTATSDPFALVIHPNPAPTISGSTAGCQEVGVLLQTESYSSYQWYRNGTLIPSATAQSYSVAESGAYSVSIVDENGCSGTSPVHEVTINPSPIPIITGPSLACGGATLSTQSFDAYQWFIDGTPITGAISQNYDALAPGSYTVFVTDVNGCQATSPAFVVYPVPEIPIVSGLASGCGVVEISTGAFSTYQWLKDGIEISGATGQSFSATQSGIYSVRVENAAGCTSTSTGKTVTVYTVPAPAITGDHFNTCPATSVLLSTTEVFETYQWYLNGNPISGGILQTLNAVVSGNYKVSVTNSFGCSAITANYQVFVDFCPETEVSPSGAVYPVKLVKDGNSFTGFYLYFQKLDTLDGYNIYEGDIASPWDGYYHHDNKPGSICSASIVDLGTGQMRAEITPSAGNHYYLVTAYGGGVEGPSGFNSDNVEIDPLQSTCSP